MLWDQRPWQIGSRDRQGTCTLLGALPFPPPTWRLVLSTEEFLPLMDHLLAQSRQPDQCSVELLLFRDTFLLQTSQPISRAFDESLALPLELAMATPAQRDGLPGEQHPTTLLLVIRCRPERQCLFFLLQQEIRQSQGKKCQTCLHTTMWPHLAKPPKRQSLSTSCGAGVSPSGPRAPSSSSIVEATARATVQAKNDPHRNRHDCSARRRINSVSPLAFALANWAMKLCVSCDHRPPTSTASTARRALPCTPANSGYVLAFLRRASAAATPS